MYLLWAGVLLSLILGLAQGGLMTLDFTVTGIVTTLLVLLGLAIGFMNITEKEKRDFLIASVALLLTWQPFVQAAAAMAMAAPSSWMAMLLGFITGFLNGVAILVAPAALVVALKAVKEMAES